MCSLAKSGAKDGPIWDPPPWSTPLVPPLCLYIPGSAMLGGPDELCTRMRAVRSAWRSMPGAASYPRYTFPKRQLRLPHPINNAAMLVMYCMQQCVPVSCDVHSRTPAHVC